MDGMTCARCVPTKACNQRGNCARARRNAGPQVIDASISLTARQPWCPMFIDARWKAQRSPA